MIEQVLTARKATLVVDDVEWSTNDLLDAGRQLADEISRQSHTACLLTVSTTNPARIIAAVTAAQRLHLPALLLDPAVTATRFGPEEDVLISDATLQHREGERTSDLPSGALLFQTSGSTSAPKAVVKSFTAVLNDSSRIADYLYGDTTEPQVLCAAPVFHSYGFTHGLFAGVLANATTTFRPPSSSPQSLAKAVARTNATTLVALPNHIHLIAAMKSLSFTGLKQVVSAGAPLRAEAVAQVCRDHDFQLLNAYGASEVGTMAIAALTTTSRQGNIGAALPGVDLHIAPGGELKVRSDSFAAGYYSDGEIRTLPTDDGWYRTGDLAERDDAGLRITGRLNDVINIAGRKTRRSRLEAVLSAHPDVLEIQVIAEQDEVRGEFPVARVVVRPGHEQPDLLAWSKDRLDAFEVPRQVEWLDELPRSATGKLIYGRKA
jgi:acyl-coenzyme A synthetase/AMP-(fatty) acid ligase